MRQAAFTILLALGLSTSAAHAAETATAQASISNVVVTLTALDAGTYPWIVQNTAAGWPASAESTGVTADLLDAARHDGAVGWIGTGRSAAVTSANASASASVSFSGTNLFSAGAASSFASASGGEVATATARLWDSAFMVGGRTRVVVTMTVGDLSVQGHGGTAMALATLGLWDNGTGAGFVNAEAQAIDSPDFSLAYSGPSTLSVSWDNASKDMAVAHVALMTSAQVVSASPVPEPTTAAMLGLGLAALALRRRR